MLQHYPHLFDNYNLVNSYIIRGKFKVLTKLLEIKPNLISEVEEIYINSIPINKLVETYKFLINYGLNSKNVINAFIERFCALYKIKVLKKIDKRLLNLSFLSSCVAEESLETFDYILKTHAVSINDEIVIKHILSRISYHEIVALNNKYELKNKTIKIINKHFLETGDIVSHIYLHKEYPLIINLKYKLDDNGIGGVHHINYYYKNKDEGISFSAGITANFRLAHGLTKYPK